MGKQRRGRPAKSPADVRDRQFRIRVTDAEQEELNEAARQAGVANAATWARRVLLEAARRLASERGGDGEASPS
jgi:hypothetical protein